jgi:glycosyl transferase family 87
VQASDDVFRYAWDGRVQAAGVDPYRYPPVADELRRFRDPWLWPDDETCSHIGRDERPCTRINRLDVRTIYPPVAEAWFYVMHVLPGPGLDAHQRFYACLLSVALALMLLVVLPKLGRDPRLAVLYAWSPVAGFDIATDAHVDVLAGLFAVGAVVLATRRAAPAGKRRPRVRSVTAAILAGAAVAVKLYPALLLPALVEPVRDRRTAVRAAGFAAVALGFVLLTYLPHVLAVGPDVLGYLPGYLQEEQYGGPATRYLILGLLHLSPHVTQALAVLALVAVFVATLRSRAAVPVRAVEMVGAALLVTTPVQPWYALLLVVLAVLAARPEWLLVAAAAYPAYFSAVLRDDRFVGIGQLSYGLAAAGVLVVSLLRRHYGSDTVDPVIHATDAQPHEDSVRMTS